MNTIDQYRDKADPRPKLAMKAIGFTAQLLEPQREVFDAFLKAENDIHSFGHVLHPTLYRDMIHSKKFAQQTRLIKAALAFLDEVAAVKAELKGTKDEH